MNAPVRLWDTLRNLVSGLGGGNDKNVSNQYYYTHLSVQQLEAAYRSDWVARKIVNIPAQDATREWRTWEASDPEIQKIEAVEQAFGVQDKIRQALFKSRLYGGAALVVGAKDGSTDPAQPLNIEKVSELQFIHVVTRHELRAGEKNTDLFSPDYGLPLYYERSSQTQAGVRIHPSRVIRFIGAELPDPRLDIDGGMWGDSVLQAIDDAVKNVGLSSQGIAALITEAKIDVIGIPNLMDELSTAEGTRRVQERFELANVAKSLVNTLIMDKEEVWNRMSVSFGGLPDVLKIYLLVAAGAGDIPATRLLGQSAAGLSATGEGDLRNHYDAVKSQQVNVITPTIRPLDEIIIRAALGARPAEIHYEWNPLWQLDEVQKAAVEKQRADAFKVDVETGAIDIAILSEVRLNQLVENGTYPGLEAAIIAHEEEETEGGAGEAAGSQAMSALLSIIESVAAEKIPPDAAKAAIKAAFPTMSETEIDSIIDPLESFEPKEDPLVAAKAAALGAVPVKEEEVELADDYNPSQPRAPKGSDLGGQWISGPMSGQVKGTTAERVALRKMLAEEKDYEKRQQIQQRVVDSFKKQHDLLLKKGNTIKALQVEGKIQQYSKKYGIKNPIGPAVTLAEANKGYTPAVTKQATEVMKSTGVTYTPEEQANFNHLVKFTGSEETAKAWTKRAKDKLSLAGPDMTVGELAHVVGYTGNGYKKMNAQLRAGVTSEDTWVAANKLNSALDKLPPYVGTVYRKADLTEQAASLYSPGMIVEERGFTSTSSTSHTWSGSYKYEIKSLSARDVAPFSSHPSENEVLFKSGTRFRVVSKEGNLIKLEEVKWQ